MMHGQTYADTNGAMNSMGMEDVDDYTSDYYENQPGDVISSTTSHRRTRKKNPVALTLLAVGTLMVIGGIGFAVLGKEEEMSNSSMANNSSPKPPTFEAGPTQAPVEAPTHTVEAPVTLGPTHETIYDFVLSLVGDTALLDENSLASRALTWMEGTHDPDRFGNQRLQQRFSLACLHMATTQDDSKWINESGWMSQQNECDWYGVECKHHKLIALNLTANGLEGLIPWEITFLKDHLLSLELASNDLLVNEGSELAWMGELTNLRKYLQIPDIPILF
jgi:hypothetical protein